MTKSPFWPIRMEKLFDYSEDDGSMATGPQDQLLSQIIRLLRWLPIVFCSRARWFRKSRDRLSNSTPKSRAGLHSKMPTNMASRLLQFVYRKCCVDRLRFQNVCRLNRRPETCNSFNQWSWFHVFCSIATIIERGKARWYITTHLRSPWRCLWSRHKS